MIAKTISTTDLPRDAGVLPSVHRFLHEKIDGKRIVSAKILTHNLLDQKDLSNNLDHSVIWLQFCKLSANCKLVQLHKNIWKSNTKTYSRITKGIKSRYYRYTTTRLLVGCRGLVGLFVCIWQGSRERIPAMPIISFTKQKGNVKRRTNVKRSKEQYVKWSEDQCEVKNDDWQQRNAV